MNLAITGHRPEDCGPEQRVRELLRGGLDASGAEVVIVGMAAGVDLWAGDEALLLGKEVWCAKPWATHGPRNQDRELYERIIGEASKVVNVVESDTYPGPWCYHKRNEWMVDNADRLLAYWSGKKKGGTFACVNYAISRKVPIRNVFG